ncbi:cyclic pyranopterin phosphate synthase MoaA [bacterium E08(2017)]|nr:cyclic pyranopterin phosphate synthase MoaA [bacterium E08(2017)]
MKPSITLRVSVTDRCQFRCRYCMPEEGVVSCGHEDVLSFEEIASFVKRLQNGFTVDKLRLTGGDPLARRGCVDLVRMLSELGIPDIAMTCNAQGLAGMAANLKDAGLDRVNISLDSLNPAGFRDLTRGGDLSKTLAGIDAAIEVGLDPIKLNMVVINGVNDDEIYDLLFYALEKGCEMRYLELMPVGYGARLFEDGFISSETVMERLSSEFFLEALPVDPTSSARRYTVFGGQGVKGVVGFISACSRPFCEGCNRIRLTADGRLIGCLARDREFSVRHLLASDSNRELLGTVGLALQGKRENESFCQPTAMAAIGG